MNQYIFLIILLWLQCAYIYCVGETYKYSDLESNYMKRWYKESNESLKSNLPGTCKWEIKDPFESPTHMNNLAISYNFPTKKEVRSYHKKDLTIEAANPELAIMIECDRMLDWEKQKDERWMVAKDHPGQEIKMCMNITRQLGKGIKMNHLYDRYKYIQRTSYLITANNALIDHTGAVMFECGYYKGNDIWELRWEYPEKWNNLCRDKLKEKDISYNQMLQYITHDKDYKKVTNCTYLEKQIPKYDKVFVISASLDAYFHHLMADEITRMARYIPYLLDHPEIKIHVRTWEEFEPVRRPANERYVSKRSRLLMLEILGIPRSRVIDQSVVAETVYIPRAMSWADALKNPAEVRLLAQIMIKRSKIIVEKRMQYPYKMKEDILYNIHEMFPKLEVNPILTHQADHPDSYDPKKKNIVLIVRSPSSSSSWGTRYWTQEDLDILIALISKNFIQHNIVLHLSDSIFHPAFCMACEIIELANADIVIGIHGGGLTKQMFMPAGGIVFEMSPVINDAVMPLCGYYGNWASLSGHHHYLYTYDLENGPYEGVERRNKLDPRDAIEKLTEYYKFIHSEASLPLRRPQE